jgi:hypothetical protein
VGGRRAQGTGRISGYRRTIGNVFPTPEGAAARRSLPARLPVARSNSRPARNSNPPLSPRPRCREAISSGKKSARQPIAEALEHTKPQPRRLPAQRRSPVLHGRRTPPSARSWRWSFGSARRSARRASELLPRFAGLWPLVKHDGRAEAALLALYGARELSPAATGTESTRRHAKKPLRRRWRGLLALTGPNTSGGEMRDSGAFVLYQRRSYHHHRKIRRTANVMLPTKRHEVVADEYSTT